MMAREKRLTLSKNVFLHSDTPNNHSVSNSWCPLLYDRSGKTSPETKVANIKKYFGILFKKDFG
jgi:hypothetical protein